jgi:hypothetical protein
MMLFKKEILMINISTLFLKIIEGARHHVYAEKPEKFHTHVLAACESADNSVKSSETTVPE